ncbi:putative repeat protein (TIGR02543 family) [Paenibacillus endophyticus]|uniref:Putative repeat protein (TIGR02543 family) n=1 Tax=Paenibacillus endophyticus TaxID=1294268 RepID=A0A7W5GCY4_9BACL|nr:glycoside hydrolase family 9 protein [Paenibacillus endophyticus]MBB3155366.1 putative repeat protein (TIGR02543 family) [Paenibacillus endophyticus]
MLTSNARRLWTTIGMTLGMAIVLFVASGSPVFALKERAPVALEEIQSHAAVMNSNWLELTLVDTPYSDEHVTNTDYYTITSEEDPDFSGGVTPTIVHYRYFPEQAPYNPSSSGNIGKIQVLYRAYLKLPTTLKLKEGKNYMLSVNAAVANVEPFPFQFDVTKPNLAIHANQVGYPSEGTKIAYLSHWTGQGSIDFLGYKNFQVIDDTTGKKVYSGEIKVHLRNDRWTQSDIFALDFSDLQAQGCYRIYIPGVGTSYPFEISSLIYKDDIAYTITRALFMQRDGDHGLDDPNLTHWNRPPSHEDDAIDQAKFIDNGGILADAKIDLKGGHMDAGDRGKYPYNSAYVGIDMLMAAKYFPEQIEALGESLEIPESDNDIPDYLDELVYELDWLTKAIMNTSTDGTLANYLRPQSPTKPEEGSYEIGYDLKGAEKRMFYNRTQGPNKAETLFAAGVLAQAYNTPIMQEYYPNKVKDYLIAAKKAYKGFMAHYQDAEYLKENTYYDVSKEGIKNTWSNEMLLASSALLVATGNEPVQDLTISAQELKNWITSEMPKTPSDYDSYKRYFWVLDRAWLGAFVSMYENPHLTQVLREWAYDNIIDFAEKEMDHDTPFGASTQDEGYPNRIGWRFTSSTLMPIVVGYGVTQDARYLERIQKTWDYTLGGNAVSRSFITGLGDPQRSPRWFVHEMNQYQWVQQAANNNGWVEPPPGLPNSDIQSAKYPAWFNDTWNTTARTQVFPYYEGHAVMYRYTDSWNTQNEYSINILSANAASMLPLIPLDTYTLNVNSPNGDVFPAGGTYSDGMKITLKAKGKPGYKFLNWSDGLGTNSTIEITMDANKTVTANYVPVDIRTITVTAVNGTVEQDHPEGRYSDGDTVTLTAVPKYGYKFMGWGDESFGNKPTIEITLHDDLHVTAEFELLPQYTLAVEAENGYVKINPVKETYVEGEEVILTAVDDFGYQFDGWTDADDNLIGKENPIMVTMNEAKAITANFKVVSTFTLTTIATEGGTVATKPVTKSDVQDGLYEQETKVILTATAKPGYLFTGWSGGLVSSKNPAEVTINGHTTVTAIFQPANGLMSVDVTPVGAPGSTEENNGVYTLTSSGNKFAYEPDSFRYLLRPGLKGNTVFTAKLESFTSDNTAGAVAGIQIRSGLASNAQYVAVMVKDGKLVSQVRKGGDSSDMVVLEEEISLPVMLRIERTINRDITLAWSADGVTWEKSGLHTVWDWNNPNLELTIGLFTSAGQVADSTEAPTIRTATAQFSNVTWPDMRELSIGTTGEGEVETDSGLYVANSRVKLTAVAGEGQIFAGWSGGLTGRANPSYITMDIDKTVTANFEDAPAKVNLELAEVTGGIIEAIPGSSGSGNQEGEYLPFTEVKLHAKPALGYRFLYWEGDLIGTEDTVQLRMDGHKTISAKFVSYKSEEIGTNLPGSTTEDATGITMNASGQIIWGGTDSFRYTYHDHLTGSSTIVARITDFNATAGDARAGIMIRQSTMANSYYQGIFITNEKKIQSQFRIGATSGKKLSEETMTSSVWLKVEKNGTQISTFYSKDGEQWTQHDSQNFATFQGPYTAGLAVTAGQNNKLVTAKFDQVELPAIPTYELHTEAVNGEVTADLTAEAYPAGTLISLTATQDEGYVFTGWSGDKSGIANPIVITMDASKHIVANFRNAADKYTLTVEEVNGTVERDLNQSVYDAGTAVTLKAIPAQGYAFVGWSGAIRVESNPVTVMMDDDKTITPIFSRVLTEAEHFSSLNIGTGHEGTVTQNGADFSVGGSGGNIWGRVDSFQYVYQNHSQLAGDATIVARVDDAAFTGAAASSNTKIGIMIRQNTNADSAFQGIFLDGGRAIRSIHRSIPDGWASANQDTVTANSGAVWLKVEKKGNTFKTYYSTDGLDWTVRSSQTIAFAGSFTAGLAVASGTDGKFAKVDFSRIEWPYIP